MSQEIEDNETMAKIKDLIPTKKEAKSIILSMSKLVNYVFDKYFQSITLALMAIIVFVVLFGATESTDFYLEMGFDLIQDFINFITSFVISLFEIVSTIVLYIVIFYGIKRFYDYRTMKLRFKNE